MRITLALGLLCLVPLQSCTNNDSSEADAVPTATRQSVPEAPEILSFTATKNSIAQGESTTLSWEISDPDATVRISPLSGDIAGTSVEVSPVVTTTYTLTAVNFMGTKNMSVRVSVTPRTLGDGDGSETSVSAALTGDWEEVTSNLAGMRSECGNLSFVSSSPATGAVFAGVAGQGVWARDPEAGLWAKLGSGGGAIIVNRTSSIVYDPAEPGRWWESGTYNGPGIYRTDDNGSTFTQLGTIEHVDLVSVDFTDVNRNTLLAGAHEERNVYKSVDGGANWIDVSGDLPRTAGNSTAPHVIDSTTFLLGTNGSADSGIFRSTDAGASWELSLSVGVGGPPFVAADGTIYWLLVEGQGMVKSSDGGQSWNKVASGPSSATNAMVVQTEQGALLTVGGDYVIESLDGGESWRRLGPLLPWPDVRGIAYSNTERAVYAWRWDCSFASDEENNISPDLIVRLVIDPSAQT